MALTSDLRERACGEGAREGLRVSGFVNCASGGEGCVLWDPRRRWSYAVGGRLAETRTKGEP